SVGHWCSHWGVYLRFCARRGLELYGWAKRLVADSSGRDHRGPTVCPDGDHAAGGPSAIEFRSGHRPDLCDDDRWCWSLPTRSLNVSGCFQTTTTGNFRHHYPAGGNAGRLCNDNHVLNHQNQYERTVFMGFLDPSRRRKQLQIAAVLISSPTMMPQLHRAQKTLALTRIKRIRPSAQPLDVTQSRHKATCPVSGRWP